MKQVELFPDLLREIPHDKLDTLSREDAITLLKGEQKIRIHFELRARELQALHEETKEKLLFIQQAYVLIKNKFFGRSSEKEPVKKAKAAPKEREKRVLLPSLRYENIPLVERHLELQTLPDCACCGKQMADSGMTEDSEFLTRIPAKFLVIQQKRHKYRCGSCHGDIKTTPSPARIKEGSVYSDEMILDVSLSKYCDLIPVERYAAIAGREGLKDLPPQSLIECTYNLANFVYRVYEKLKKEITESRVLHADETPHRMLEGAEKMSWYLWGFSNAKTSYYEIQNTRSGDVASDLLVDSKCEYLMSDVFSGYGKAGKTTNEKRAEKDKNLPNIKNIYCNAHARRKFKEARDVFPDAQFFIDEYKEIYQLEAPPDDEPLEKKAANRQAMEPHFNAMKTRALLSLEKYPSQSSMGKALKYFLKNHEALTFFIKISELPIDNNQQERLLRNPVIGRKTWYGTHSKQGARTAAILFSLVESCKLNKINPREYFKDLVQALHDQIDPPTPGEYLLNTKIDG